MKKKTFRKILRIFLILISLLITLLLCMLLFSGKVKSKKEKPNNTLQTIKEIEEKSTNVDEEFYKIDIKYPYFNSKNVDEKVTSDINSLIKKMKDDNTLKTLKIDYDVFDLGENIYLVLNIEYSLDDNIRYKSYLIDNKLENIISYENVFDLEKLKKSILDNLEYKYSDELLSKINELSFDNLDYLLNKDELILYFNSLKTKKMNYVPHVILTKKELKDILKVDINFDKKYTFKSIKKTKVIALTFDDGPSDVTTDILKVLKEYDAHATFFSLGNRMNSYSKILQKEINSGHLVASHTYSHKDLSTLSTSSILNEINTTNTIFNNATGKRITLVRPPYGEYNTTVLNTVEYPLILWNIDTRDWYYLDSDKTSNTIIKKAFNGGIVLMHDLYKSNVNALKIALPELESEGYKFVTIEEMADEFDVSLRKGNAYRYIE